MSMTNRSWKVLAGAACLLAAMGADALSAETTLATVAVTASTDAALESFGGAVEAVRQTAVAAQVAGSITQIPVKVGDHVRAGQMLVRIDARTASQQAESGDAQVLAARASLAVASRDFERKQQLLEKNYISQAAFDRAKAQFEASQAQVSALVAQAGVAHTQSGFYVVSAPYDGVVADIPVTIGDMAAPGRTLVTVFDPAALRVTAAVPQGASAGVVRERGAKVEIPDLPAGRQWIVPTRVQALPTVDAATHTVEVRMDLPPAAAGLVPGMYARAWLPSSSVAAGGAAAAPRLYLPAAAVVRRAELTAVYVIGDGNHPRLRQVRLGETTGDRVEILSGLSDGENVALDPQAAARQP